MKSPKPNQNKPHHTHKACGLAIQKLLNKPNKGSIKHCCPSDEEKRQQQKSNQPCDQPDEQHPINGSGIIRPAHTTKGMKQSHKPTKQNHWHTIEFSHNTRTPKHTPITGACSKRLDRPYTHPHNKQNRLPCESNERIYQRLFSYRHLTRLTIRRGVVGHADSHKATHTQPTTQTSR